MASLATRPRVPCNGLVFAEARWQEDSKRSVILNCAISLEEHHNYSVKIYCLSINNILVLDISQITTLRCKKSIVGIVGMYAL